jgi:hypothetical protein
VGCSHGGSFFFETEAARVVFTVRCEAEERTRRGGVENDQEEAGDSTEPTEAR